MQEVPEDFFVDIISQNNFLVSSLSDLFANAREHEQGWKFCIFREPRSEPKKIKEPKKLEVKGGEREKEKRRGKKEKRG